MFTLDRQKNAPTQSTGETPSLRLRFDGLTLDLKSGKNTVGSSPRCDIRIPRPGVQPLHCLIIHQANGTVVRRWAGETVLNGLPIDEATLQTDDCIQVGPANLSIVGDKPLSLSPNTSRQENSAVGEMAMAGKSSQLPVLPILPASFTLPQPQPTGEFEHLQQGREIARERSRRLLRLARRLHREHESLQNQIELLRSELAEKPVIDSQAPETLQLECEALRQRDAELVNQVAAYQQQAETTKQLSDEARHDAESRARNESSLTLQIERLEADCAEYIAQLKDAADKLSEVTHERAQLATHNEQLTIEIEGLRQLASHEDTAELDRITAECNELRAECERLRSEASHLPQLKSELKEAVAERENASSELYRALLQLSELEDRDRSGVDLEKAQAALNAELDKSTREIADLQVKLASLTTERQTADETRLALDRRLAELIESHQQIACDKTSLAQELSELRIQLESAQANTEAAEQQLSEVDEARARIQSLEASLADAEGRILEARETQEAWQVERHELAMQVADLTSRIAAFQIELEEARCCSANEAPSNTNGSLYEEPREVTNACQPHVNQSCASEQLMGDFYRNEEEPSPAADDIELTPLLSSLLRDSHDSSAEGSLPKACEIDDASGSYNRDTDSTRSEPVQTPHAQQASFIDRYSHMFSDESSPESPDTASGSAMPRSEDASQSQQRSNRQAFVSDPSAGGSSDDEESIEEYMAKLLQRVRGESSAATSSYTDPAAKISDATPASEEAPVEDADSIDASNVDYTPRRPSTPFPQTDLESLRALANESARRAISRHAIQKHRRTANTKLLIAVLAVVVSVFLMMGAGDWSNPKFMAGAAGLLIAAYCAGETLRAWIQARRVAATRENEVDIEELTRELEAPMCVESEEASSAIQ